MVDLKCAQIMINDQFVPVQNISFKEKHPEVRTDHGQTKSYGYNAPDITLRFQMSATNDIFDALWAKSRRNENGVIPECEWKFKWSSDGKTFAVKGKLFKFFAERNDVATQKPINIEGLIRVTKEDLEAT